MTEIIKRWPQFEKKVRLRGVELLKRLDDFPDSILVTGCQRSGTTMLTKIIAAIGLSREQVYICNVLKCRPPGNRDPHPDEVMTCSPYLDRQLELLQPKVICTLGRHSTLRLTGQAAAMKTLHGRLFEYQGFKVMPTYHPAALLRNPSFKALVWEDVQKLRAVLDEK